MPIHLPEIPAARQRLHGYGDGGFRINGKRVEGAVLITPTRTLTWPVTAPDNITLESLLPVLEGEDRVDLLLIGCGAESVLLPRALRESIRAYGVGLEVLDTGAACRTFNLLLPESRRVAAALIAV